MVVSVENFFAKYPKFNDENDSYRFYDESAERALMNKLEFTELELQSTPVAEEKKKGSLFNHQRYIARFASSYTGYDELLLVHEMGTGKTCTAIGLAEKLRYEKKSWIKGAVVVAKGTGLLKNFVNELLFVCTDGRYVPENYSTLTELEKTIRVNRIVKKFYDLKTFETFAKEIESTSDSTLKLKYENKLFIFDEIHNVRWREKKSAIDVYSSFHRLLHLLRKRKILLMSGTPMKDDPSEIASVMNLLLDANSQLPVGKNFHKRYLGDDGSLFANIDELRQKLRGKTSYLKASSEFNVRRIFAVNENFDYDVHPSSLKHFVTYDSEMSEFQANSYSTAYERDKRGVVGKTAKKSSSSLELELFGSDDEDEEVWEEERNKKDSASGIYLASQQASLMVYPDGSYGSEGFDRYITQIPDYGSSIDSYVLDKEFVKILKPRSDTSVDEIIENIRKYSCKYAAIIERAVKTRNKTFVYCSSVTGSGAIAACKLLELCGYRSASSSKITSRAWRYMLVSNKTMSENEIRRSILRFNEDRDGTLVQILVGSRVVNEGYTLRNVLDEHVVVPHWNYSETAQAIARGWRTGSHDDKDAVLTVYQHVAKYVDNDDENIASVDELMYAKSEAKDLAIKSIERLIKETSFDCALSRSRNKIPSESNNMDGQRECEYASCEYNCFGGNDIGEGTDDSSYNVFYSEDDGTYAKLIESLRRKFLHSDEIDVDELRREFNFRDFEFSESLTKIVRDGIAVRDRYGFVNFVRIKGDRLILSTSYDVSSDKFVDDITDKYLETNVPWETLKRKVYDENIGYVLKRVFNSESFSASKRMIANLDEFAQRLVLEICVYKKYFLGSFEESKHRAIVEDLLNLYFKDFYGKLPDGRWYISLHADKLDGSECYDEERDKWSPCDATTLLGDRQTIDFGKSPVGYYGLYNPQLDQFCIKDVRERTVSDVRRKTVGRRCLDWESYKLVELAVNVLKLEPPESVIVPTYQRDEYERMLAKFSKGKLANVLDARDGDAMKRFVYWSKVKRALICDAIKQWFGDNGYLADDFTCGQQKKSRLE